jgi:hypothetical protein
MHLGAFSRRVGSILLMSESKSVSEFMNRDGSNTQFPRSFRLFASWAPFVESKIEFHSCGQSIKFGTEILNSRAGF